METCVADCGVVLLTHTNGAYGLDNLFTLSFCQKQNLWTSRTPAYERKLLVKVWVTPVGLILMFLTRSAVSVE